MTPTVIIRTDKDSDLGNDTKKFIDQVISTISHLDCKNILKDLIGNTQANQKVIIKNLQKTLQTKLNSSFNFREVKWEIEVKAHSSHKDSFDLFLEYKLDYFSYKIIIELDKHRADQIAKKFLSRLSHTIDNPIIYFAFCYPGTKRMNLS